jgi:CBS-domain-containing membrane protein
MAQPDAYLEARLHRRRRVEDVMTTAVVTADRLTPYKEIARLLAEHHVSSLPVLAEGWQVIGVVSETELLAAQDRAARLGRAVAPRRRTRWSRPPTLTAGDLMTAPVTIRPDTTLSAATRVLTTHHVTSLPVTGADRQLIGIVSGHDLLSVFLRPDADILCEVRRLVGEMPFRNPADVIVTVRHGVVTLAGAARPRPDQYRGLVLAAIRLIWAVDGVVDVVNKTTKGESPRETGKSAPG